MSGEEQLRRVTSFQGVEVYAARCDSCGADEHTAWKNLPTLADLGTTGEEHFKRCYCVRAYCHRCERILDFTESDAVRAREPERLEARLRELRAKCARPEAA